MSDTKLKALAGMPGWNLETIADENYRDTGWRPNASAVSRRLAKLGLELRHSSRSDMVPWKRILPRYRSHRYRAMLQAESRRRAGDKPSRTDKKLLSMLYDLLFGRGTPLVIGHNEPIPLPSPEGNTSELPEWAQRYICELIAITERYRDRIGWFLADREATDKDIIRVFDDSDPDEISEPDSHFQMYA